MVEYDFVYDNKSIRNFGYIMVAPDEDDSFGLSRELIRSEITASNPYPTHYGAKYSDTLTLPIRIIKDFCEILDTKISRYEIRQITSWLTSCATVKPLYVENMNHDFIEYDGVFIDCQPYLAGTIVGFDLIFKCDSPYGYTKVKEKLFSSNENGVTKNVYIDSDELYEEIEPVLKLKPNGTGTYSISNGENELKLTFNKRYDLVTVDCKYKMIIGDGEILSLEDVGFNEEVSNENGVNSYVYDIDWISLHYGKNEISFSGDGTLEIECKIPQKIGGFASV